MEAPIVAAESQGFNPYLDNGGTVLSIAVGERVVVGCDTRLSQGFNIINRNYSKITQLTSKVVIASAGMTTDAQALHRQLQGRIVMY
jgi:20S proteasome subunit beta 6